MTGKGAYVVEEELCAAFRKVPVFVTTLIRCDR